MRPDQYQKNFFEANFQLLQLDPAGVVQYSNQSFLPVKEGDLLADIHPFFESLSILNSSPEKEHLFHCIHLAMDGQEFITDITVTPADHGSIVLSRT